MADYENLLDSIDAVIRSNNRREITGQILQNTLHQMVASLGENYQLAGFATPTLDPSEPDQNVFYLTDEAGVYTNFDNITLGNGLSFLMWKNGAWSSKTMNIVTAQWVDNNYVSKAFLRQMFRAYDEDGVEIFANDTTSIIDNIKAMCGLWTNQYLSALGLGADGGGGASTLAGLNDVQLDNLQDGQALVYDLDSFHWVNRTIQSGVDMSVVWAALAAATNEQINVSHLTTALSGYVTSTALATTLANYVTTTALASALADYAAQSWVETNYISKLFFNSLFQAEDSEGNAITPNNSGQTVIDRLKILVGAYTDQYLSALGLSEEAGASSYLYGLGDVQLDTQILAGGQALVYSASLGKWTNGEAGVNMVQVWTALATADATKQIDISHISNALSGYVTTSSLTSTLLGYVTTSALSTTLTDYVTNTSLTTTLAAYGTKSWVESNYISKAFFNRMFRAFAPVAEGESEAAQVEPNDVTTEIDNIKAMFGLWTEQYLSALGLGSDAGHTIGVLDDLNDVKITNPQNDQVLKYNNGEWVNAAAPSGATALSGLTDVAISSLADKDLLQWDYASGKWKNVVLLTVMSGYATQNWVQQQGYITSSGSCASAATLTTSRTLWGQSFNGSANVSGDMTGVGEISTTDTLPNIYYKFYTDSHSWWVGVGVNDADDRFVIYDWTNLGHRLVIDTTGKVGINTGTDSLSYTLNVNGSIYGTSFVKANGTSSQFLKADGSVDNNTYALSSSLGNYLPISGGTMNGTLSFSYNSGGYSETYSGIGLLSGDLYLNTRTNKLIFAKLGTNGISIDLSNITAGRNVSFQDKDGTLAYTSQLADYLPLSGGTMAGNITMGSNSIIFGQSTTPNWNVGAGTGITLLNTVAASATGAPGDYHIGLSVSGYYQFQLAAFGGGGSLLFRNGTRENYGTWVTIIDSSTIGSQSVNYANSAGSVAWSNVSGRPTNVSSFTNDSGYITSSGSCASAATLTTSRTLWGQSFNGSANVSGDMTGVGDITTNQNLDNIYYKFQTNSYAWWVGIGISGGDDRFVIYNASGGLHTLCIEKNGNVGLGTSTSTVYYKLHVAGDIYATGGVTALSDIRHKTIVEDTRLQVSDIARMRAVRYIWDDGRKDNGMHVGSIAQDWQQILPEVVLRANNDEGTLSLQYGVAALISSITIARKVVDHEERITALEKENADLKQAYSFIKNAYDYLKMDYEQLKLKIA